MGASAGGGIGAATGAGTSVGVGEQGDADMQGGCNKLAAAVLESVYIAPMWNVHVCLLGPVGV